MELMKNKKNTPQQPAWRRSTILALVISLLAGIATIFLGVIRGLVSAQVVEVANTDNLNRWILISAGVIVLGLALYAILEPDRVSRFLTRRQTRYGSNTFVMSLAFAGILIVGSVMAYQ